MIKVILSISIIVLLGAWGYSKMGASAPVEDDEDIAEAKQNNVKLLKDPNLHKAFNAITAKKESEEKEEMSGEEIAEEKKIDEKMIAEEAKNQEVAIQQLNEINEEVAAESVFSSAEFSDKFYTDFRPEQKADMLKSLESQLETDQLTFNALTESGDTRNAQILQDQIELNKRTFDGLKGN